MAAATDTRPASAPAMPRLAPDEIVAFLIHEARLLDERRWDDWLALFAGDAWYWVPVEEGQADPRTVVSLMYDDRRLLETRVRRLVAGKLHTQAPPARTSRIVANATVENPGEAGAAGKGGIVTVRSKFQMTEYRRDRWRHFAGTYWHGLKPAGEEEAGRPGGYVICWKKVELVDCDAMLDGLTVPF